MDSGLTVADIVTLATIMTVGAMVPGVSVLAVAARSAAYGFGHGAWTAFGIVAGDVVFLVLAIFGLSVLAELMGSHFVLVKYIGGAYLIVLGVVLWRSAPAAGPAAVPGRRSFVSGFLAGLLTTLGDQKAILFYLGFLPAFMDLAVLSALDAAVVAAVAAASVGTPKLAYAWAAHKAGGFSKSPAAARAIKIFAAAVMVGVGLWVVATA